MDTAQPAKSILRCWVPLLVMAMGLIGLVFVTSGWLEMRRHREILACLRNGDLSGARAGLEGSHRWNSLLPEIEASNDPRMVQAALDVQFEYWYSDKDDTNHGYPEHLEVVRQLVAAGATPSFEHLLKATQQNKMRLARLFLHAGVPARRAGSADTPLSNAAYWGDNELVSELLRHGAQVDEGRASGWTPILAAAWSARIDCVTNLLARGADLNGMYEPWSGNPQPIWRVIEERAALGPDAAHVWVLVRSSLTNRSSELR